MSKLDNQGVPISTHTFVNVYRWRCGKITTQSHAVLERAIQQAAQVNAGKAGKKCIARIRVPVVCVEGQFDF